MTAAELTDEERDWLWASDGGLAGALGGATASAEATIAVSQLLGRLQALYPNRPQRLAVLGAMAQQVGKAREELLSEILDGGFAWVEHTPGDWRSVGWPVYLLERLAKLAGLGTNTLHRKAKAAAARTLASAQGSA